MFPMKPGNSSFFLQVLSYRCAARSMRVFPTNSVLGPLSKIGNADSTAGFPLVGRIALVTRSRIHFSSVWLMRLPRSC